jgi:hypothetical protein
MVFAPHYRVQWGGGIFTASNGGMQVEVWSNTLSLLATGGLDPASGIEGIADALTAFHASAFTSIDSRCALQYVKVNQIGADGKYVSQNTNVVVRNQRGASQGAEPIQSALRVSLDDGSRNPRARGGWYIPCFTGAIQSDWQVSEAIAEQVAGRVQTLLAALNAPNQTVVIASRVGASLTTVTRLRVGRQVDTIRRRRNAIPENYFVETVNPGL